jgi:hypothetical protein
MNEKMEFITGIILLNSLYQWNVPYPRFVEASIFNEDKCGSIPCALLKCGL